MEKLIAYCGLDCSECGAHLAWKNNDQAMREKTALDFAEWHGFKGSADEINCAGCKGGGILFSHCSNCEIRKCASKKAVVNCGSCSEFKTCKTINDFITEVPHVVENFNG